MAKFVLTNDDGAKSPLLKVFLNELADAAFCSHLDVCIPAEEQSWIGHAMTRFRPIHKFQKKLGDKEITLLSGTPADCANIAVNNLFPDCDYLISGINMGNNAGLPVVISSGTVNAAISAALSGKRSIAISAILSSDVIQAYLNNDLAFLNAQKPDWTRISQIALRCINELMGESYWKGVDLYSINIPWGAELETPWNMTTLARPKHESFFIEKEPNTFVHKLQAVRTGKRTPALGNDYNDDLSTLSRGEISIAPLKLGFN